MSTHKDIMVLIDFIESICDEDMKAAHNLAGPLSRLKPPIEGVNHTFLEIVGECANCEKPIDRYSPHERCWIGDELVLEHICNNCCMSFTDEELAEKDIIRETV